MQRRAGPARLRRGLPRALLGLALVAGASPAGAVGQARGTGDAEGIPIDTLTLGDLRARSIGPAVMSGRIAAIDAVSRRPLTVFVGAAGGGVWRSRDGATTFEPVFDEHPQSIGAIRIDPSDPDTIWVGTGESWVRNSVSVGNGVYKSSDGGDNWTHAGLADSERIARIAVDPRDGDVVHVCATGHLWDGNDERGVFTTRDGGGSWERSLFVDADTGCADLTIDPGDPDVLFAAMWEFRRRPDFFVSGGPGSGLYRSLDGGVTWSRLQGGLPDGELGRIGIAVAPSAPETVYAVVESDRTALYRSDDRGDNWRRLSDTGVVTARPFYFAHLVVDPDDPERVYKPSTYLGVSSDGGRSFATALLGGIGAGAHADHHALWIDPADTSRLLLGTDGGLYVSSDRGAHWRHVPNLPLSQFYEVAVDNRWPYNVYGGLQDNGSWRGPSRAVGGVRSRHWENVGMGDGFHAYADPSDPDILYTEWQGGRLERVDVRTGEHKSIAPFVADERLRFNWNAALHLSEDGTLYVGAQFLFRSTDRGDSWERISPDLTTDNEELQRQFESGGLTLDNSTAENHTTIFTISESPLDPRVIWVGTDDGRLHVTRDAGATWTDVGLRIPDLPGGTWISHVQASHHHAGTAYATLDGHRTGDMATYVYVTRDFGSTWQRLGGEVLEGWAHVIVEDVVSPDLLFLGTELGLFVSVDGGRNWARFRGGIPSVAVRDMVIHRRDGDLVIGTHGRGVFILDDLTPLRVLTAEALQADAAMLPTRATVMPAPASVQTFPGDDEFVGANPPEAAFIYYHLRRRHLFGPLRVDVLDASGEVLASMPGTKRRGINRVEWPMRLPAPDVPAATTFLPVPFALAGPRVPAGTYRVRLTKGDATYESMLTLVDDPRTNYSAAERAAQDELVMRQYRMLGRLKVLADGAGGLADGAAERLDRLSVEDELRPELSLLAAELEALRASVVTTDGAGFIGGQERLRERLLWLYGSVNASEGAPTQTQVAQTEDLDRHLAAAERQLAAILEARLARLNVALEARGLATLGTVTEE